MSDFKGPRSVDIDQLERRVLDAARREEPSAELSKRMAGALGISAGALAMTSAKVTGAAQGAVAGGASQLSPTASAPQAGAGTASGAGGMGGGGMGAISPGTSFGGLLPWISGAVVIAAVAAGVTIGMQSGTTDVPTVPAANERELPVEPNGGQERSPEEAEVVPPSDGESAHVEPLPKRAEAPRAVRNETQARPASDLREEIALMDQARAAVRTGSGAQALALVAEYRNRYPRGSFRPEASALQIEALVKLGRKDEAQSLARRFVAERRGTPLADRVARIAGLDSP